MLWVGRAFAITRVTSRALLISYEGGMSLLHWRLPAWLSGVEGQSLLGFQSQRNKTLPTSQEQRDASPVCF